MLQSFVGMADVGKYESQGVAIHLFLTECNVSNMEHLMGPPLTWYCVLLLFYNNEGQTFIIIMYDSLNFLENRNKSK